MMKKWLALFMVAAVAAQAGDDMTSTGKTELATFGGGCFWCMEAVFEQIPGVAKVTSGYTGGHVKSPSYHDVTSGDTGHAEAIQIEFDPQVTSFDKLLDVFWDAHDPTQLNRQGNDVGEQYRSVIFYHSDEQKKTAQASKEKLAASGHYSKPIVTPIQAADTFFPAEKYHQEYYRNNRSQPYCQFVIRPKLEKLGLKP
ncbi:MAG TPA: peptide-methionine (S)-S-oxide reductase MsrA [Kiritimatiellia bacterium]|jgi:peptide-methionine (S)-S-oxide reductase